MGKKDSAKPSRGSGKTASFERQSRTRDPLLTRSPQLSKRRRVCFAEDFHVVDLTLSKPDRSVGWINKSDRRLDELSEYGDSGWSCNLCVSHL